MKEEEVTDSEHQRSQEPSPQRKGKKRERQVRTPWTPFLILPLLAVEPGEAERESTLPFAWRNNFRPTVSGPGPRAAVDRPRRWRSIPCGCPRQEFARAPGPRCGRPTPGCAGDA